MRWRFHHRQLQITGEDPERQPPTKQTCSNLQC